MRTRSISNLIRRAYGRRYDLDLQPTVRPGRTRYYLDRARPTFTYILRQKRVQIFTVLILAIFFGASIHYYNLLVTTEQDMLAAIGKVDALLQRRNDISINLSKAVLDYSAHERNVFTAIVALRSVLSADEINKGKLNELINRMQESDQAVTPKVGGQAPGSNPLPQWADLLAVAEQYPDLKLSTNFQSLMTALIDVEKDLADERIRYNDAANIYSTNVAKFPVNIYARIFKFQRRPYFEATEEAKTLKPIEY